MIYRILASRNSWSDDIAGDDGPLRVVGTKLCGAFSAGVNAGFEKGPTPHLQVPSARFSFTELG